MLKRVEFPYLGDFNETRGGTVVYLVDGDTCVFSGITTRTSTINAAQDIISTISAAEGIDPTEFKFFDLQTCLGYSSLEDGQFRYDLVRMEINKFSWEPVVCPHSILDVFSNQIGRGNPIQMEIGNELLV